MQTTARRRWPTRLHNDRSNGRGIAVTNFSFASVLLIQPSTVIRHGEYMYVGPEVAGAITQFNVTADPRSGVSTYKFRTYLGGIPLTTGPGVADDLQSLMVYTDPSAAGVAAAEVVTKLPLWEDMP